MMKFKKAIETFQQFFNPSLWFTKKLKFKLLSLLVEKNSISQEVSDYIKDLEGTGTLLIGSHLSPVRDAEDLRVNQRIFEILKDSFGVLEDLPSSEFVKLTGTKENFLDLVIFLLPEFESYYFIILDREITLV